MAENMNSKLMYFVFSVMMYLIFLKDAIKISDYYVGDWLNKTYLLTLIMLFFVILIKISRRKINLILLLYIVYFIYSFFSVSCFFVYKEDISLIMNLFYGQFFFTILCLMAATFNTDMFFKIFINVQRNIFYLVVITFLIYILLLYVNTAYVTGTLMLWMDNNLIVNPIQASGGESVLRFSSIFYSSYSLALFMTYSMIFSFFTRKKMTSFLFVYVICLIILMSTLNRNGIFLYLLSSFLIFVFYMNKRIYKDINIIIFVLLILCIALTPILLLLSNYNFINNIYSFDSGLFAKISTLMVRMYAWETYFKQVDFFGFIFGTGFVQGLGNDSSFIDNGFYNIMAQSGVVSVILFLSFVVCLFVKSLKYTCFCDKYKSMSSLLILVSISSSILNISFNEINVILFSFSIPYCIIYSKELRQA